jgi:hypothetical protein
MTSSADPVELVSVVTIGGLEDIGYQVNYGAAEGYTAAHLAASCNCNANRLDGPASLNQSVPVETDVLTSQDYADIRMFAISQIAQDLARTDGVANSTSYLSVPCAMSVVVEKNGIVKDVVMTDLC